MTRTYSTEQWFFRMSNLNNPRFIFGLREFIWTENMTAILREIEHLPAPYWNARPLDLHEARNSCLEKIESIVNFLEESWPSLHWYSTIDPEDAARLYQASVTIINETLAFYNRLYLVQYCLLPERRYLARRRG